MVQGDSTLQDLSDCIDHVNYGQINFNHRVFICEISCNDKNKKITSFHYRAPHLVSLFVAIQGSRRSCIIASA